MAESRPPAAVRAAGLSTSAGFGQLAPLRRIPPAVTLLILAAITFAAYLPALRGGILWDDNGHITKPALRSVQGLYRIWFEKHATQQYYPLLHSAFWVEHHLWGDAMQGYHLANLLLHLTVVFLVYAAVRKLQIPGALLAAAIFALHPVQVETVAWVTEQKNTLSAVFYLSALLAYLQFDERRQGKWYALALALFLLGLLSKTVVASLPAALLVIFWWQRGRLSWRRDVLPLLPFFALGAIGGLITASVEQELIGYETEPFDLTFSQRILLAGRAVWFYLATLFWPFNLIFIYPRWTLDATQLWQWLFPAGVLTVLAACWSVRNQSRAPLAAALFFIGTLFPALGFVNVFPFRYSFVADHFQYLASLGVIVPLSAAVAACLTQRPEPARVAGTVLCAGLIGVLATLTCLQSRMYGNVEKLYETTIEKNPDCWMAYSNLGLILMAPPRNELSEATKLFEKAVELNPDFREAHSNLGLAYQKTGRRAEGIEHLRKALEMNPYIGRAHFNLGSALLLDGRPQEAVPVLEEAIHREPSLVDAYSNLGSAYFALGRAQDAIPYFEQALRLQADFPKIHNNLGAALFSTGQKEAAIEQFQQAVKIAPDDASSHNDLGWALFSMNRLQDAIAPLEQAVRLNPGFLAAQNNLGRALLDAGRPQEAIEHFERALQLAPDNPTVQFNLAQAYAGTERTTEATSTGEHALNSARAQGQTELARQIEAWLTSLHAGQVAPTVGLPSSALPPASP